MAAPVIQFKRGAFVNLPGLRAGEPGFTTDKHDLYVGLTSETSTNKFFGSARYWQREISGTQGSGLNLVNGAGNKVVTFTVAENASGIATYKFPTSYTDGYFLKVSSDGTLSWIDINSNNTFTNASLSGITTISGTLDVTANASFTGVTTISNVDINDGTIDGVVIGGTTPDIGYFTLVDTDRLISDNSTIGFATATDFHIDSTRVLYNDGAGITLAGIQTIDATTKTTLETILAFDPNNFDTLNVVGIATIGGLLDANGGADISGLTELDSLNVSVAATFASARVSDLTSGRVVLAGTGGELQDSANLTFNGTSLTVGTGVGITQFSASVSTGTSTSSVPTSSAVIDYVGSQISNVDLTLGINADTGGPSTVNTSQTLTISGTANEVNTSVSGQTITVGLPDNVTITGDITIGGNDIKASNGTTALTLATTGAVTAANDLTVTGNLYVNGSTTQVNTAALTVEDRTIDLGIVNGSAPASATTWDLGILFNYFETTAKKSAVIWEHSTTRFQFASNLTSESASTDANSPQIVTATFAPIEIGALWVTDCAGTSQVISCTGTERFLENITVDAGVF